jgi:hypothetical protein
MSDHERVLFSIHPSIRKRELKTLCLLVDFELLKSMLETDVLDEALALSLAYLNSILLS